MGVLGVFSGLYLTGCGQKGDLYLPTEKTKDIGKPAHVKQADEAIKITSDKKNGKDINKSADSEAKKPVSASSKLDKKPDQTQAKDAVSGADGSNSPDNDKSQDLAKNKENNKPNNISDNTNKTVNKIIYEDNNVSGS